MAERLTEKDKIENKRYMLNSEYNTVCVTNARLSNCSTIAYCWGEPIDKLAQLEDIMDKYGIESVEELDNLIANYRTSPLLTEERIKEIAENEIRKTFQKNIQKIRETEYRVLLNELNTWKKACELALKSNGGYWKFDNNTNAMKLFYQQAKTEGNDENNKIM